MRVLGTKFARRLVTALAALGVAAALSGCVVAPGYGYHDHDWHHGYYR